MVSKFYFGLTKTAIFQAVKWERSPVFRFVKLLKKLFLILFVFSFLAFCYGFLLDNFYQDLNRKLFAFSLIFLVLFIIEKIKESFFNSKIKKPLLKVRLKELSLRLPEYNPAEFLSFEAAKAIYKSINFVKKQKLAEINSSILFYFLLKDNPKLNFIFSRIPLNLKETKKSLKSHLMVGKTNNLIQVQSASIGYSKDFENTILESLKIAQKKGNQRIEVGDILTALAIHNLFFKKILIGAKFKAQDIANLVRWLDGFEKRAKERERWWDYKNLMRGGTLAKEWTAGYTLALDKFSRDWTEIVKKRGFPEIIGHKKELKQIERILANPEVDNVLLVGGPGTGRKSIVELLIMKSLLGQSLPEINYKKVKELDLPALLARAEDKEEVESTLDKIFQEAASAGNIILVIDKLNNFVGVKEKPGSLDISGILAPYLKLPQFQIIAITDFVGLHKNIEQNPHLLSLFEKVEVSETSEKETLALLENLAQTLEIKYKKIVSYPALRDIIIYTKRYYPNLLFPEKATNLLNEAMVYLLTIKGSILLPRHVAKVISEKIQIPVGEIEIKEREILLNLEKLIHKRIINQDEAVNEAASAFRRARAEVTIRKGPIGCFLFLGPTGVGKTETAKALAEIYFGSELRMIGLNMSEFQSTEDIPRLIGSAGEEGLLTTEVMENPFSLILLDEIEKAHPNVLNLFLQVFEEGILTDGLGRKVDFKNSIIIATSNAGYKIILKALESKTKWNQVHQKLLDYIFEKAIFRPELINRFDAVVVFRPLTKSNLLDIVELMLQRLKKNLEQKDIELIITNPLKEKIVELGYSPVFGAREMRRVIQEKVENVLAKAILLGELKRGNKVGVDPKEFRLIIK